MCVAVADIVFLIDSSESIGEANYRLERTFVNNVIRQLGGEVGPDGIHVGAVVFGTEVQNPFFLNTYTDTASVTRAVDALPYLESQTNIARAIIDMRDTQFSEVNGDRPNVPNIAVLITDGRNEPSDADRNLDLIAEATRAKRQNINIISVAVGPNADRATLTEISAPNAVFEAEDFRGLSDILLRLSEDVCAIVASGIVLEQHVHARCSGLL